MASCGPNHAAVPARPACLPAVDTMLQQLSAVGMARIWCQEPRAAEPHSDACCAAQPCSDVGQRTNPLTRERASRRAVAREKRQLRCGDGRGAPSKSLYRKFLNHKNRLCLRLWMQYLGL